jgi:hypothetical protein
MILALAGRRIDAPDSVQERFPFHNLRRVTQDLRTLFTELKPKALVCSAANGADLLALETAGDLAIDRKVVLPFTPEVFRSTSVIDRPGEWGERFDRLFATMSSHDAVLCLDRSDRGPDAYRAANAMIIKQAHDIARSLHTSVTAVLVWDGQSRGAHDMTFEFRQSALNAHLHIREIRTL